MAIRPRDFWSENPPPRIIGGECEENMQRPADTLGAYIGDAALTAAGINHHGPFLGARGGRGKLYVDVGHIETDTAECMGPASAAVADLDMIDTTNKVVTASGIAHGGLYRMSGTFIPHGRVGDTSTRTSSGRTSGYHENYMIPRDITEDPLIDMLIPTILATRLYAMSGTLRDEGFVLSQKVWGCGGAPVERALQRRTSLTEKPMLMIPSSQYDSDTIGPSHFARGEVRVGEPGLSLVGRFAGFAAVSLGFRLIELQRVVGRKRLAEVSLVDPVQAAKDYAGDLTLTRTAPTRGGKSMTALNIQEAILEIEKKLAREINIPEDEFLALDVIESLIGGLNNSWPPEATYPLSVRMRIDFVARQQFIGRKMNNADVKSSNAKAMQRNLDWDMILPQGSGRSYWQKIAARDPLDARIREYAMQFGLAPRALARAALIDSGKTDDWVSNWAAHTNASGLVSFGNPYGN